MTIKEALEMENPPMVYVLRTACFSNGFNEPVKIHPNAEVSGEVPSGLWWKSHRALHWDGNKKHYITSGWMAWRQVLIDPMAGCDQIMV